MFEAYDTVLGMSVAMNHVLINNDDDIRDAFLREYNILMHLDHPNIIKVYGMEE